jgi:uncharacterized alkaline shock family protein YloU
VSVPNAEFVVADAVIAGVAARAAAAVPGVSRLEPGVRGLVARLARSGMRLWTGRAAAPFDGVRVMRGADAMSIHVDLAISAGSRADEVGVAVQREVSRVVAEQTGVGVDAVTVVILDIEPEQPR